MQNPRARTLAVFLGAVSLTLSLGTSGCYSNSDPTTSAGDEAYTPMYYEGRVVFYDDTGVPYVSIDHKPHYVLRDYLQYDLLVANYRGHEAAYRAWYAVHGAEESDPERDQFHEHHRH